MYGFSYAPFETTIVFGAGKKAQNVAPHCENNDRESIFPVLKKKMIVNVRIVGRRLFHVENKNLIEKALYCIFSDPSNIRLASCEQKNKHLKSPRDMNSNNNSDYLIRSFFLLSSFSHFIIIIAIVKAQCSVFRINEATT